MRRDVWLNKFPKESLIQRNSQQRLFQPHHFQPKLQSQFPALMIQNLNLTNFRTLKSLNRLEPHVLKRRVKRRLFRLRLAAPLEQEDQSLSVHIRTESITQRTCARTATTERERLRWPTLVVIWTSPTTHRACVKTAILLSTTRRERPREHKSFLSLKRSQTLRRNQQLLLLSPFQRGKRQFECHSEDHAQLNVHKIIICCK